MAIGRSITLGAIISLGLGVYFLSAIIPGAFDNFFSVNTTGWDPLVSNFWVLIPFGIIAALVLAYMPKTGGE